MADNIQYLKDLAALADILRVDEDFSFATPQISQGLKDAIRGGTPPVDFERRRQEMHTRDDLPIDQRTARLLGLINKEHHKQLKLQRDLERFLMRRQDSIDETLLYRYGQNL